MFRYKIPTEVYTNQKGYEFLSHLYCSVSKQEDNEILLDFSDCQSFDANLAAALGAILDRLLVEGYYDIHLTTPTSKSVRRSLSRNHFFRAWNVSTLTEDRENFIIYKKFRRDDTNKFKLYIDEWLIKKQKFPKHSELVGTRIIENIFEIYSNAIMHGETDYVYACGEYHVDDHTLDMTIVDCGLTIPHNVNTYLAKMGQQVLSPCEAIEWAFEDGHTTKENTGGIGLAILKQFIGLNKGCLQMVSGDAFLEFKGTMPTSSLLDLQFPGTIVNMKFNFEDDNSYRMEGEIDYTDLL